MGDLWMYRSGSAGQANAWINTKQLSGSYGITGSLSISGSITGSLLGTASTASYYRETDPIFTAKSASLATTGSNNFNGNQTITGSLAISGGLGLTVSDVNGNSLDANNRQLIANSLQRRRKPNRLDGLQSSCRKHLHHYQRATCNGFIYSVLGTTRQLDGNLRHTRYL